MHHIIHWNVNEKWDFYWKKNGKKVEVVKVRHDYLKYLLKLQPYITIRILLSAFSWSAMGKI